MNDVIQVISTVGFPIAACIAIAYAMYKFIKYVNEEHKSETEDLKRESAEREERLQNYLEKCQETNSRCITQLEIIADRLDKLEKGITKDA